jgi:TIR domain/AAA domain
MATASTKEKRWTVFLSYSWKDQPFVDWLYSKLRDANLTVWYDKYEIRPGDSIPDKIEEGLKGSDLLIAVISQWAAKSELVKAELKRKLDSEFVEQQVTVLPVVLDDTKLESASSLLRDKKYIQLPSEGSEEGFQKLIQSIEGHIHRRSLIEARPAPSNPFGLRGGIDPEHFVVPETLVRRITEDIVKWQSLSIVGPRMIGKTSLLKFLASPLYQDYYQSASGSSPKNRFVYFDLQQYGLGDQDKLLPELAAGMSKLLPPNKQFQGNSSKEALDWIKHTAGRRKVSSRSWVLLIDEFDRVVELSGADQIPFNELRSLPQYYNLCYVIASHHKLINLPLPQIGYFSPFFNFFKEYFLTVWDKATARKLMVKPLEIPLEVFRDDDIAFMMQLTACHPLLLQIGCYYLFNLRSADEKKSVDNREILDSYMQDAKSLYQYYWDHEISNTEREWLSNCLETLCNSDKNNQEALQKLSFGPKNQNIRIRLAGLGLVLNETGLLELPLGFQKFLLG